MDKKPERKPVLNGSPNGNECSLVSQTIGGRTYPLIAVPQCRVCNHPLRQQIEKLVVEGYGYASIVRLHLPAAHGLSSRNLGDHVRNGHLPVEIASVARYAADRADERKEVAESGADLVQRSLNLVETVLGKVSTKLAEGALDPGVREGLAAARLILDFQELTQRSLDRSDVFKGFLAYVEEAKAVMTPGQFSEFGHRLARNPLLRALREAGGGIP